ncbi:TPA: hypothetical protein ACTUNV_002624 [Legionella pneumophila]
MLDLILKLNRIREDAEAPFHGLPHTHKLLINILLGRTNPDTGVVYNISYTELSKTLTVDPAPGRKDSGTPTKQTIRNWIKTIERECGDYFKVISEGQKLQFQFTEMPKIFKEVFHGAEANTVLNNTTPLENTEQNTVFEDEVNMELNTEANTPMGAVKNIFINKNINNNYNKTEKKCIDEDFKPNAQTIERALALGFTNANDPKEIQNFIAYNQANGSKWADFNPIYLRWLTKCQDHQKEQQIALPESKDTRSVNHATANRTIKTQPHKLSIRERVINAWSNELAFCERTNSFMPKPQEHQSFNWDVVATNG